MKTTPKEYHAMAELILKISTLKSDLATAQSALAAETKRREEAEEWLLSVYKKWPTIGWDAFMVYLKKYNLIADSGESLPKEL